MAEILIKLPDSQLSFFKSLVKKLGYIVSQKEGDTTIPDWQKEVVKNRIDNLKEENLKDWDEVKKSFKVD